MHQRHWPAVSERLAPLMRLPDATSSPLTEPVHERRGALLFELLFGDETQWEGIFRNLFHQPPEQPRPNPIRSPVKLRICTDDPQLLSLPWRLTAWHDYRLVHQGWTFATTQQLQPTDSYTTTAPCNVLIVAPRSDKLDATHVVAVADVLRQVWPLRQVQGYLRTVRTRQEVDNALLGMPPHLIYIYAQGTVHRGHSSLLLEGGKMRLTELADRLRHQPPAAIYLNVTGLGDGGLHPAQTLGDVVPLVIWRRLSRRQPESTTLAVHWLRRWLQDLGDPVAALHEVIKLSETPETWSLLVHANYRAWRTHAYHQTAFDERLLHLKLDRDEQKALVDKHLGELVRSDTRRVMALVAYAEPGNRLGDLQAQLQYHLELEMADLAEINWCHLQFPTLRDQLLTDLTAELRLQLQADDNEPLPHLIRRHAPSVMGSGKRGILWINWGCFGPETEQAALTPTALSDWLRFASDTLASECPDDLRIVSYAAMELPRKGHDRLRETLGRQRREPWCRRPEFRLSDIPPLDDVSEDLLFEFLVDGHSSCEPAIHDEVAQRLIEKTGGNFEAVTRLMQEAENNSWYDMLTPGCGRSRVWPPTQGMMNLLSEPQNPQTPFELLVPDQRGPQRLEALASRKLPASVGNHREPRCLIDGSARSGAAHWRDRGDSLASGIRSAAGACVGGGDGKPPAAQGDRTRGGGQGGGGATDV